MKKFDWFLLGYTFKTTIGHGTGSVVKGFSLDSGDKNITNADIAKLTEMAKKSATIKEPIVDFYIMSISYLGHMTEKEFNEEQSQ
jgi:hypothetical protein